MSNVYWRGLQCDIYPPSIFWEVLEKFQKFLKLNRPLMSVLDIGAHAGSLSLLAAHHGAREIVAVDPVHEAAIMKNIKNCGFYNQIEYLKKAVAKESGEKTEIHFIEDGGMQGYFIKTNWREPVIAETVSFESLLERFDTIDYLKIDVEGCEFAFIEPNEKMRKLFERVRYINIETHVLNDNPSALIFYNAEHPWILPEYRTTERNQIMLDFLESCGFKVQYRVENDFLGYRE